MTALLKHQKCTNISSPTEGEIKTNIDNLDFMRSHFYILYTTVGPTLLEINWGWFRETINSTSYDLYDQKTAYLLGFYRYTDDSL